MATMKFKIGDKVIGNHPRKYAYTRLGWKGVVTRVYANGEFDARGDGNPDYNGTFSLLEPQYFDLISTNEKIVITHDGKVTTATMYGVMGTKTTATARCAPEDKFDFEVGAKLAMERLMEKVNPPVPKYYSGKVVCIHSPSSWWTKGKIYSVMNGIIIDDDGDKRYDDDPITPEFNGVYGRMFLPIIEDKNDPLTIEELNKMDGQKVWLLSLDVDKKPYPDNFCGGWHIVNVKNNKLVNCITGKNYGFKANDVSYGFLAYRQAPSK